MALTLNIEAITNVTHDWTFKVQIMDICRELQSPEKKIRFENLILEAEEEQQVRTVTYADGINQYAEKLVLLNTYLISTARVKASTTSSGRPIHKFYWIFEKEIILEEVKPTNELEKLLSPPTKLNITAFDSIAQMTPSPAMEIGTPLVPSNTCLKLVYPHVTLKIDDEKLLLSISGTELEAKMEGGREFLIILIFHCKPDLTYLSAGILALINWAKTNKVMLSSHTLASFARSSTAPTVNLVHNPIVSIAEITSTTSVGVLYIEAKMSIMDDLQDFCVLECSGCKQKKRTKETKQFDCPKCQRKTTLVPWCTFQIDLIDGSSSTTTFISDDLAEKLLSITAEDIYDTTYVKTSLAILSYTKKEHVSPSSISKRNTNELEMKAVDVEFGSSSSGLLLEPPTPMKKL